ncbi:hypothetical protein F2Q68_00024131 [Brassica cretica]|uniref:Uncharacterized protein n=1 Tax=Brassica cretica TaxID=69181 RepID=A0A8S9IC69_BRACR|nr:hypothetical protein F2Q68_00024131 [Brassica cretica]
MRELSVLNSSIRNRTTKRTSSWTGRELERAGMSASDRECELSPSYRAANGSCSCPGCKLRMDGAEAEFV